MRWPWTKRERETISYTDRLTDAMLARADGGPGAKVEALAIAGAASRLYANALALARIEPATSAAAMLLPARLRAMVGAQLALSGNAVLALESTEAGLMAVPATGYADGGDFDPASWLYTVELSGPGAYYSRRRRGADLLHFRLDAEPRRPWRGVSPLARAGLDGEALAVITAQLRDAGSGPHGFLLSTGQFEDDDARKAFDADLRKLRGDLATVDRGDFNEPGGGGVTGFGLLHTRIDQGLQLLRRDLVDAVAAAAGIPAALLSSAMSGGVASREAYRQLGVNMLGVGELLAAEIGEKLDERVTVTFDALAAHDIRARATSYKALVDAGVPSADAARIVGLEGAGRADA